MTTLETIEPEVMEPAVGRRWTDERRLFAWTAALCIALLVALAGPFLAGRVYTADDLGVFHLPMRTFYAERLAHGGAFDWSPQLYCGFYLTGEGQVGVYHPLHLLLYGCLPLGAAFCLECLLGYPALLLGTFWLLRRWQLPRDAALVGGMALAFSGFCLLHFVHVNAIEVVAHLPWLLVSIDVALRDGSRTKRLAAGASLALLTGSQLLLGYPQYVWLSLLAEIGYAILLTATGGTGRFRRLDALGFWEAVGWLIGGIQLLPTWDALRNSSRQAADAAFSTSGSLDPLNIVQWVAPYLFRTRVAGQNTHELGLYAGAVTLMLAVWALTDRTARGRQRLLVRGAAALGVVGLLLAIGEYGPLGQLVAHLPLVNNFRFPCRAIVLVHLALAILAAVGWAALSRKDHDESEKRMENRWGTRFIWLLCGASVVLAICGPFWWPGYVANASLIWAGPALMVLAATLITLAAKRVRGMRECLLLLAALDLGAYGLSYAVYAQTPTMEQFIAATAAPPGPPIGRVSTTPAAASQSTLRPGDRILMAGWHCADGYAGLEPRRALDYQQLETLRLAGVNWMAAEAGWLRLADPLPRVRLVTDARVSVDPAHDLPGIPLESAALVERGVELSGGQPGTATLAEDHPGDIRLRVAATGQQLLVVSESFHDGWRADAETGPLEVLRVNGDFLGCVVDSRTHDIHLHFQPLSLRIGTLVSACGLGLLVSVVLLRLCRRDPSASSVG